jgi:anti-sigma regulatory factor (Ser/Thr protein kinase)
MAGTTSSGGLATAGRNPETHREATDSENPVRLITSTLPVSTEAPALARETLGSAIDPQSSALARDAQLLVSELVTHRVRRSLSEDRRGTLRLDVSTSKTGVRVEVTDENREPASRRFHSGEQVLDWGLQIVAEIADRWGIRRSEQTTIWFELDA